MMKKVLLGLAFALMSVAGYAQGVLGKWYTEAGDAQVEIYQSGDKLNGKIVWLHRIASLYTSLIIFASPLNEHISAASVLRL